MDQTAQPTMLYRFFDAEDRLLYVGISSVGPARWDEHARYRAWWEQVVRSTVETLPSRAEAALAEQAAIRAEKPLYNIRHVGAPREPRPKVYRPYGGGTVIYRPERDRWVVVYTLPGRRHKWLRVKDQAEGEAVLEIVRLARAHPAALTVAERILDALA